MNYTQRIHEIKRMIKKLDNSRGLYVKYIEANKDELSTRLIKSIGNDIDEISSKLQSIVSSMEDTKKQQEDKYDKNRKGKKQGS